MVAELLQSGVAEISEGAACIKVGKQKDPPFMIRKSDGGFLYASTDLACLRYRVNEVKADRIVYLADVG